MSGRFSQDQALRAARDGRAIHRNLVDQTVTNAFVVEVGAGTYYDIPAGHQVIVSAFWVGCETVDEFAAAYMVECDAVTGGGTPTALGMQLHDHVGTKKEGFGHVRESLACPLCIKYSAGARSVSMALKATDAATVCMFGWCGWVEQEGTLS